MGRRDSVFRYIVIALFAILICCGIFMLAMPRIAGRPRKPQTDGVQAGEADVPENMRDSDAESTGIASNMDYASVKLLCGDYKGCGVVWEFDAESITILTTAHLLVYGETATVYWADGSSNTAIVTHLADQIDVAFAKVARVDVSEQVLANIEGARSYPEEQIAYGTEAQLVAAGDRGERTHLAGTVIARRFVPEMNNVMLILEMTISPGMSGSPVYDSNGYLLGIAVAGNTEETLVVPADMIGAE